METNQYPDRIYIAMYSSCIHEGASENLGIYFHQDKAIAKCDEHYSKEDDPSDFEYWWVETWEVNDNGCKMIDMLNIYG